MGRARLFLCTALGIGAMLLIDPTSNIAPVYGVFRGPPVGFVAGLAFGLLHTRRS